MLKCYGCGQVIRKKVEKLRVKPSGYGNWVVKNFQEECAKMYKVHAPWRPA